MWYLDGSSPSSPPASPDLGLGPYSPLSQPKTSTDYIKVQNDLRDLVYTSEDLDKVSEDLSDSEAFGTLWKMFEERQKKHREEIESRDASWEMIVIQAVLLSVLVLISILWAFCCKKKCFSTQSMESLSGSVASLARKLSNSSQRDLPPSYSKVDLRSVGLTINDHLNPPPSYDWALEDTLIYCNPPPSPTPGHVRRFSRFSVTSSDSEFSGIGILSRGNSRSSILGSSLSRKTSRVTFLPELEMGPTPSVMRGDSNISLPIMSAMAPHSARRKSVKSEGYPSTNTSRRVSFADEFCPRRKKSSIVDIDPKLEEELKIKLALIGKFDTFEPIIDGILNEENDGVQVPELTKERSFSPPPTTLEIINETESD